MAKYYAVVSGKDGNGVIYRTWDQCKRQVIGHKGAIYKSFTSEEEAINFIKIHGIDYKQDNEDIQSIDSDVTDSSDMDLAEGDIVDIYVDGSYNISTHSYSYGMVVVSNNNVIHKDNGVGEDERASAMRNVAGEVLGSLNAVKYAIENKYKEANIFFDYQGIQSWALGTWKRNNYLTQDYHKEMQELMKKIKINFIKVKGHSGDLYNDMADRLAKDAIGIK